MPERSEIGADTPLRLAVAVDPIGLLHGVEHGAVLRQDFAAALHAYGSLRLGLRTGGIAAFRHGLRCTAMIIPALSDLGPRLSFT
jgi:hypothetical protein